MKTKLRFLSSSRVKPLAMLLAALPLFAQAQSTPPAEQSAPAEAGKLETVTVTAERRSENIKDVPSSITALRGEKLDVLNSGGQDIRFLAGRVPSLNIESSFGRAFPRFYIRGLGNTDFDLNASQPVSLLLDDVVQENAILKGFPIFDVDQVEVLRGPQGTLFGRNSPAGVVKFESAKPRIGKLEGYGNVSIGSFSTVNTEGALNFPAGSETAIRLSTQMQRRGDWVDNTAPNPSRKGLEGYTDAAFRGQLLYQPSTAYSLLFNFHYRNLDGTARLFRANIIKPGTNELVDNFDEKQVSIDGKNEQNLEQTGGSVRARFAFADMALTSITGFERVKTFSRGDVDGGYGAAFLGAGRSGPGFIPFSAESADGMPKHSQLTQEFRLESTGKGPLKWLGGLYYFDESFNIDSFNYDTFAPGQPVNGYATQQQGNKAWAVFGSLNYDVSDALKLRGGLRYTNDKKDFVANRLQAPPFSPTFIGQIKTDTDVNNVSGDVSGTYALSKDTNFYARLATGFRAPSIQGRLLFGDSVSVADSEKVTSYEAGVKSELFDRRARVAFNVFQYNIKNQQLTAVGGAANFNQLVNAAKTTGQGFEVDLSAYLTENLLLTLGGSYNDTKIKDPNLYVQPCGGGCTVLDPAGPKPGTVSINGNPLPQAPKTVVNFTARYGMPMGNGEAFVYTDWAYRGKINFFLYESKEFTGKPLTEGGLRLGYNWSGGKYEAAVFGRNITNQIRVVGGIDFNNLTGFVNEPRTVGVQFKGTL